MKRNSLLEPERDPSPDVLASRFSGLQVLQPVDKPFIHQRKDDFAMAHSLFRTATIASLLAAPALAIAAAPASADKANFWIYNDSNVAITELYVSESSRESWDSDILGADVLVSGASLQVVFGNPSPSVCFYDVLAVFADGQVVEDYQVNVCSSGGYTFYDQ